MMNNTNYTLCLKKVYRLMFDNNFGKGEPFSKSFHQLIRRKILYVYTTKIFTNACNILLDYLVKVENPKKKLLILTANLKKKKNQPGSGHDLSSEPSAQFTRPSQWNSEGIQEPS